MQELLTWMGALPPIAGLALSIGANPVTYAATTDVLARRAPWPPLITAMTTGLMVGATFLFTLFHFVNPDGFLDRLGPKIKALVWHPTVDLTAGCLLLAAAVGVAVWRLSQPELIQSAPPAQPPQARVPAYFLVGLSCSIIGFTTLPAMYLTEHLVSSASASLPLRAVAYAVFLFFLVAPFFAIALIWTRLPGLAQRVDSAYSRLLQLDYRWPLAGFCAATGLGAIAFAVLGHR